MALTSLYSGLSGLNANALQLSLIGNNLANVNTPGFKSSTASFQDLLSQTLTGGSSAGNINFLQVGLGVTAAATNQNFSQGSLQSTGISTNVAIQGEGFFIVKGDQGVNYTRAGDFHIDASGNLVTSDGALVQGYTQKDPLTNKIITSGTLDNINIPPGTLFPPISTTLVRVIANLDANAIDGTNFTSSVRIYDSLGAGHQVNFTWTKTGVGTYNYDVTIDGGEVTGGTPGTPFSLLAAPGTMTFDNTGALVQVDGAAAADAAITTPIFSNGASALTFTWDLVNPDGTTSVTSYAAPSATSSSTQNGFPPGTLSSVVIGGDGTIQGIFSSGKTAELARLALATFNNPGGLLKMGSNRYNVSISSGEPSVGVAGEGGRGSTAGSTLELSNVDMASEFINMIVAQRGYQANSKMITTTDEILQDAINLKR
ncbi:MAG: flagellar hook protein FlgE [Terriglobia bacterium]